MIANTHYRQTVMGYQPSLVKYGYKHKLGGGLKLIHKRWQILASRTWIRYTHPPHKSGWLCIHRYEGRWTDGGDPYWGGLQMDRGFMSTYAPKVLLRKGWANRWSVIDQMWVAERAHRSGRGYWPWPNTARFCGLL